MKKKVKLLGFTLTLVLIFMTQLNVFGQTEKKVQFTGLRVMLYIKPIQISPGKYRAYFENMGEYRKQGQIIINDSTKTFTVKWLNGNESICKYTKIETKKEKDKWFGDVTKTIYTGKWIHRGYDALLMITVTKSSGCITTIKSKKVVDKAHGIDTWQTIYNYATAGRCFQ